MIGTSGIEVAKKEARGAILPLGHNLDGLHWISIAVALAAVGVAIYAHR